MAVNNVTLKYRRKWKNKVICFWMSFANPVKSQTPLY